MEHRRISRGLDAYLFRFMTTDGRDLHTGVMPISGVLHAFNQLRSAIGLQPAVLERHGGLLQLFG